MIDNSFSFTVIDNTTRLHNKLFLPQRTIVLISSLKQNKIQYLLSLDLYLYLQKIVSNIVVPLNKTYFYCKKCND